MELHWQRLTVRYKDGHAFDTLHLSLRHREGAREKEERRERETDPQNPATETRQALC